MLKGLIDHWVPSHSEISSFWKTPIETIVPLLDRVMEETNADHFTFYTKWYTNGIRSSLPFLANHPGCMNVISDDEWGQKLIAHLHDRGASVGAMLQCCTFEAGYFPKESVLGCWDQSAATGMPGHVDVISPAWPEYGDILNAMLDEHLSLFPGLDAVFLEFEGLAGVSAETASAALGAHLAAGTRKISGRIAAMLEETPFLAENEKTLWLWTEPIQDLLKRKLRTHLMNAERVFTSRKFKGTKGLVYKALGYELPYAERVLPSTDWWLLPWYYWGWGRTDPIRSDALQTQMDYCRAVITEQMRRGFKVCYIGNATLPTANPESIEAMLRFCAESGLAGYMGMGSFIPEKGLKWHGSTGEGIEASKQAHARVFGS